MERNMMQNMDNDELFVLSDLEELAGKLDSCVISPLEEVEGSLPKVWEDEAAKVFLSRLAVHRELIESVQKKLLLVARQEV